MLTKSAVDSFVGHVGSRSGSWLNSFYRIEQSTIAINLTQAGSMRQYHRTHTCLSDGSH
jgi:hypothetical protein